jgi:hypothetical protein
VAHNCDAELTLSALNPCNAGKGSFGEVFLVQDKRDGQQYVMKVSERRQAKQEGEKRTSGMRVSSSLI